MDEELQLFLDLLGELGFEVTIDGSEDVTIEGASTVYIRRSGDDWHAYPDVDGYDEFGPVPGIRRAVLRWLTAGARDWEDGEA